MIKYQTEGSKSSPVCVLNAAEEVVECGTSKARSSRNIVLVDGGVMRDCCCLVKSIRIKAQMSGGKVISEASGRTHPIVGYYYEVANLLRLGWQAPQQWIIIHINARVSMHWSTLHDSPVVRPSPW